MGGSDQWRPQATLAQDRQVLAVDLPGFGRNAHLPPLNRIGAMADWVLDHLRGRDISRFDLLGHSMGGMVVQDMVHRAPEKIGNLILYATGSIGVLPGRFETIEQSMQRAREDGPLATARRISATWFLRGSDADAFEDCATIAEQSEIDAILAGLDAMREWSGVDRLGEIAARTLVIWGDRDRTYTWRQIEMLWQYIPDASLAVIPGCAHAVHLEKPDIFNRVLADFLGGYPVRTK